jgi:serine/threonine-protein kinase RsbW
MKKKSGSKPEELIIASDLSQIKKVEKFIYALCKKARLSQDQTDNMAIAITELVNNGIIHANKYDPQKHVTIRVKYESDRVIVAIIDEGEGFDPEEIDNPTDPENLWKQNGRGIFLVKNLIDGVEIISSSKGTKVVLTEYLP